jgi:ribosomal protein S18 acetylase RimI-like enzyme
MKQAHEGAEAADDALMVRPARPDDRGAILALCDRVWGGDDYIRDVWESWMREEADGAGALLVAERAGVLLGIMHMRMVSDDEGWIEAIRVDPDARRQGIARTLTSRALVSARERGAAVARLFVDADNVASQTLVARFGFTRIAELLRYQAPALEPGTKTGSSAQVATASEDDFERIWAWLEQSTLTPFNGGVEMADWAARAITEPLLHAHLVAGNVRLIEEWETISALAILAEPALAQGPGAEPDEARALEITYLTGSSEGIGRLALALRSTAFERDLAEVKLWLPDLLILRDAMDGAGYAIPEGDEPLYLYAREL